MAKNSAINISSASSVIVTNEDGVLTATSPMTNGQMLIGSTGSSPVAENLTAGSGITITPGAGTLSISVSDAEVSLLNVQYLTSGSGTYTATTGTASCVVLAVGGGGPGMSFQTELDSTSTAFYCAAGGSSAAWGMKYYATAPTGTAYSVGSGGTYTSAGVYTASTATTFNNGDMNLGGGGRGEEFMIQDNSSGFNYIPKFFTTSSAPGVPSGSDNSNTKGNGSVAATVSTTASPISSNSFVSLNNSGASSYFGPGGIPPITGSDDSGSIAGNPGLSPGSGGSGAIAYIRTVGTLTGPFRDGGPGANGIIIVYEYS